jgi:TRAP-type C4-dicarboxylate transport system permease small subunit
MISPRGNGAKKKGPATCRKGKSRIEPPEREKATGITPATRKGKRTMPTLTKVAGSLSEGFNWIAVMALAAMMFLTSIDVILRYFGLPIDGTYEIVSFLGATAAAFALGKTTFGHGHVSVNLITKSLPPRLRRRIDLFTRITALVLFAAISWECFVYAKDLWESQQTYGTIELPIFPVVFGVAIAFSLAGLVILAQILETFSQGAHPEK